MPATYEPIATTTLSGTATVVTFSSIPNTYTDLRLVFIPITGSSVSAALQFNADTGTNYSRTSIQGDGTSATSSRSTSNDRIDLPTGVFSTPTMIEVDFMSYAGSTNKTLLLTHSRDLNTSGGNVLKLVGLWRSTSAINRIDLIVNPGNYTAGTTATLYGIKAA